MSNPLDGQPVAALVLAGARASGDPLCAAEGVESKALIDILGMPMLARVLQALSASQSIRPPAYVSGLNPSQLAQASAGIPAKPAVSVPGGPAASLMGALSDDIALPVLVTTCDHALLTPEMVDHFVTHAQRSGNDLTIALAERDTIQSKYPETQRTYLQFGGMPLSGCNLFYVANRDALKVIDFWRSAERDRKRPWRIAWRFGPLTALRILVGRPGVDRVFALLSARMKARIGVVLMPFAEAAIDVDSSNDLDLVRSILTKVQA